MYGSIRRTCRHRWLPMTVWKPGQVTTQNLDGKRRSHQDSAHPEAPVTVHSSPIWTRIGLTPVATISFGIMLIAGQFVDSSAHHKRRTVADATSWRGAAICTIGDDATKSPVNCDQHTGPFVV